MPKKRPNAKEAAEKILPLLAEAKTAYGSQAPNSPARVASETVNAYLLEYVAGHGKIPELIPYLNGEISLSGIRRRVRIARATEQSALEGAEQVVGRVSRPRGTTDPEKVKEAVEAIQAARDKGGRAYGDAVRKAYDSGVSLGAIAKEMGISYYSLWSARRTSW